MDLATFLILIVAIKKTIRLNIIQNITMKKIFKIKKEQGFTILFAIIVAAAVAIIGGGIFSISSRQAAITGTDASAKAAYAVADAAIECALYQVSVEDAFGDGSVTTCNGQALSVSASAVDNFEWEFTLSNINGNGCATVYIDTDFADNTYQIKANGIHDCRAAATAGVDVQEVQLITELEIGKALQRQGSPYTYEFRSGSSDNLGATGTCLYAGNMWVARQDTFGFEQFDVSDPDNITSVRTIGTIDGSAVTCAVYGNKLYLASAPAVQVYSLADPNNPTYESIYWTSVPYPNPYIFPSGRLNHINIHNGYMYVSLGVRGLDIVRLSDLSRLSNFNPTYNNNGVSYVHTFWWTVVLGDYVFSYGLGNANILSINVADKTSPSIADDFCCNYPSTSVNGALLVPEKNIIYWGGGGTGGFVGIYGTDISDPTNLKGVWLGAGKYSQVIVGTGTGYTWQPMHLMDGDLLVVRGETAAGCPAIRVYDVGHWPNNDTPNPGSSLLASTTDVGPSWGGFSYPDWNCKHYGHLSVSGTRIYAIVNYNNDSQGRLVIYDFKDKLESTYRD